MLSSGKKTFFKLFTTSLIIKSTYKLKSDMCCLRVDLKQNTSSCVNVREIKSAT